MKTITLFSLILTAFMFGCAHQAKHEASEPEALFMEEEDDEGYIMLSDEDVGISREKKAPSEESDTSTSPNP
jgi:hypothetical protein